MSAVPTRMTLTPAFDGTKRMSVQGSAALYEKVAVTVAGVSDVAESLILTVTSQCGRIEYARFPANVGDVWTVADADLTCTLDLNTPALYARFRQMCLDEALPVRLLLANGATGNLYAVGGTVLQGWPQNPANPVAGSLQLQTQLNNLTERIATHQHDDGEGSASFPHNNLTGRDAAGAHPVIEAEVANAALAAANANSAAGTAGTNASTALALAEQAVGVTAVIQDGGTLGHIAANGTLAQTKALLNAVVDLLNGWRALT